MVKSFLTKSLVPVRARRGQQMTSSQEPSRALTLLLPTRAATASSLVVIIPLNTGEALLACPHLTGMLRREMPRRPRAEIELRCLVRWSQDCRRSMPLPIAKRAGGKLVRKVGIVRVLAVVLRAPVALLLRLLLLRVGGSTMVTRSSLLLMSVRSWRPLLLLLVHTTTYKVAWLLLRLDWRRIWPRAVVMLPPITRAATSSAIGLLLLPWLTLPSGHRRSVEMGVEDGATQTKEGSNDCVIADDVASRGEEEELMRRVPTVRELR